MCRISTSPGDHYLSIKPCQNKLYCAVQEPSSILCLLYRFPPRHSRFPSAKIRLRLPSPRLKLAHLILELLLVKIIQTLPAPIKHLLALIKAVLNFLNGIDRVIKAHLAPVEFVLASRRVSRLGEPAGVEEVVAFLDHGGQFLKGGEVG